MRRRCAVGLVAAAGLLSPAVAFGQGDGPVAPPVGIIAEGVSIDGVAVGGLTRQRAVAKVLRKRVAPRRRVLPLQFGSRRFRLDPVAVGYKADVRYAVRSAYTFGHSQPLRASMDVPLRHSINQARLRAVLRAKGARLEVDPVDAAISFSGSTPAVRKARFGARLKLRAAQRIVARAIVSRNKNIYKLPSERVRPARTTHPPAILIERGRFRLTLFKAGQRRSFTVAVGQPAYPTPVGNFRIILKQRNPTWFPPDSPWAAGIGPVAPGPANPLGTRWMGTSATAIGIHGTPTPSSLGTRASHGCIRMSIPEAEWLYDQIDYGTSVVIR